jgi:O-antigen/teichoic acid export membrane protein
MEKTVFEQSSKLIIGRTVAFGFKFLLPIILVRVLTVSEFGLYKQMLLISITMAPIFQFGLGQGLYYFLPGEKEKSIYITQTQILLIISGLIAFVLLIFFQDNIAYYFHNEDLKKYILPLSLMIFFTIYSSSFEIILISKNRPEIASLLFVGTSIITTLCVLSAILYDGSLFWIVWGLAFAIVIRASAYSVYLLYRKNLTLNLNIETMLFQLRYSIPFGISIILYIVQQNIHFYIVSFTYDSTIFAIFAIGCLSIPLIDILNNSVGEILIVKIKEFRNSNRIKDIITVWRDTTIKLSLIFIPFTVYLFIVADEFITVLFTENYAASVPLFMVFILIIPLYSIKGDAVIRSFGKANFLVYIYMFRLISSILLIFILMNKYGLIGIPFALVLVEALSKIIMMVKIGKLLGIRAIELLPKKELLRVTALALFPALAVVFFKELYPHINKLVFLIISGCMYSLIYWIIVYYSPYGLIRKMKESIQTVS